MHDLAIRNAEICDGMGSTTYAVAVALADGVIIAPVTCSGNSRSEGIYLLRRAKSDEAPG